MKRYLYLIPGLALSALTFSCQPNIEKPDANAADLDLSKYVAYGDYITAGFTNGGIYDQSQFLAYPKILTDQFIKAGGSGNYSAPVFNSEGTPMLSLVYENGMPVIRNQEEFIKLTLADCQGLPSLNKPFSGNLADLNNFGVPALKIDQLRTPGLGNIANQNTANYNPFFERLLPAGDNRSYLEVAEAANPTFFTAWFGMSDVMAYALSGGGCDSLPEIPVFETELNNLLTTLTNRTASGKAQRKGVLLNLPSYEDLPIAYTPDLLKVQQDLRKQNNSSDTIWVTSYVSVGRPSLGQVVAPAKEKDILTPKGRAALGQQGHGLSKNNPLLNDEVLDQKEVQHLSSRMNSYNSRITSLITNPNYVNMVILGDMKTLFGTLRNGVIFNGVKYDLSPVKGGVFSLDNFTLTPRGQAIVANKIIQAINLPVVPKSQFTGFGASIPEVNVNDYPVTIY